MLYYDIMGEKLIYATIIVIVENLKLIVREIGNI